MDDLRLYSPNYVKQIINDYDFKFSKSLGQNFLIDGNIVRNIVKSAGVTKEDGVIEVGPGIGTLTEEISLQAKKVVSVEIDKTLLPILDETLGKYDNIKIVNDDAIEIILNIKLLDEYLLYKTRFILDSIEKIHTREAINNDENNIFNNSRLIDILRLTFFSSS